VLCKAELWGAKGLPLLLLCAVLPQVSVRARELDTLKLQLGKLMAGLEAQAAADKEVLAAQTGRLARESARLEALQVRRARTEHWRRSNCGLHICGRVALLCYLHGYCNNSGAQLRRSHNASLHGCKVCCHPQEYRESCCASAGSAGCAAVGA
jgi:hypothetical protein